MRNSKDGSSRIIPDKENGNKNNNSKRRSELNESIVLQILSAANGGATEIEIKTHTDIGSDELLREYLDHLIKNGLVGYYDRSPSVYRTTDKGLRFLESLESVETGGANHKPPKGLFHIT